MANRICSSRLAVAGERAITEASSKRESERGVVGRLRLQGRGLLFDSRIGR